MSAKGSIAVLGIKGLPSRGGGERVAEAIIKAAVAGGYEVTVYGKRSYCETASHSGTFRLVLVEDFRGKHLNPFLFGLLSVVHALLYGRYDMIHLHYADFGYLVPLLRLRFKVIGTSHGAEYNRDKWNRAAKLFFRLAEVLFVKFTHICTSVSKPLAEYYMSRYRRPVIYIPNGIDFAETDGKHLKAVNRDGLNKGEYILFAAGRIIPSKGCDLLLKANNKLGLAIPLVIVGDKNGDPGYDTYLKSLASSNVRFIDFISSKDDLFALISNCRFFVFPSQYEAMSVMLLEVASLRKGIVCSDIAENVEAIDNNGVYFKSGDAEDLAEKIAYAVYNQEEMDALGVEAYEWVKRNRNWQDLTARYLALFDSMAVSRSHTSPTHR